MNSEELKFDPYALIEPKSHQDFMALANEALSELRSFNESIACIRAQAVCPEK
jgi:hypothetical protein